MVAFSLARLGVGLAVFLLQASDAVLDPSPGGVATVIGAARMGWRDIAALKGRRRAVDSFGGRIASRLEAEVADARRRCEERGVDAGLLRGAVTEAELLLGEFAADDAVTLTIAREPDRIEGVVRRRAQKHRQNVGAGAEPFFDALVRAIIGEITRLAGVGGSRQEAADGVAPAFQSVLEQIRSRSPRQAVIARCQLETLALLAASGVPARWLEFADEGSDDAREALNALIESSVCRLSKDGSTVGLHPLQGLMIRESWEAEPAHRERIEKEAVGLLDMVNTVFIRESQGENRRREVLDLADQLREIADQDYSRSLFADPRTGKILAAGLLYVMELEGIEAAISLSNAVDNLGRSLGPDNSYTLISRNNLACAYRDAGRLDEAIDLFEQVLADRLRALEPDHLDILVSRNNLADAYELAERLDDAISLFEQNLTDCERILGPDHPGTLTAQNNLADVYKSAGRLNEAIDLCERTLADQSHVLGPDHPDTLTSRNNLAYAYRSAGRLEQAIPLFEQTLADSLRVLGPDNPDTLASRHNLASAYCSAGRFDKAIPLLEQNLAEALRVLGSDHPNTRIFRDNLADAYRTVGRDEDAAALLDPPSDPDDTDAEAPA